MSVVLLPGRLANNGRLRAQVAWGADLTATSDTWTWTDITSDVRFAGPIKITKGRPDEFSTAPPSKCMFQLNNPTGAYSKGPQSTNYPNVHQNVPVRVQVSVDGGGGWLSRAEGYIVGFTPRTDTSAKVRWVEVEAYGKLRQLIQGGAGKKPIRNVLTRYHLGHGAVAVWPFDDGTFAEFAASATSTAQPMRLVTTASVPAFNVDLSSDLPAADRGVGLPIPDNGEDVFAADVNASISNGEVHIDFWRQMASEGDATETQLIIVDFAGGSASLATIEVRARMSQISPAVTQGWVVRNATGAILDTASGTPGSTVQPFGAAATGGTFHNIHVQLVTSGSSVVASIYIDGDLADSTTLAATTLPTSVSTVHIRNSSGIAGQTAGNFDHLAQVAINLTTDGAPSYADTFDLYDGELVTDRLTRLCAEQGVEFELVGSSTDRMGPQPIDTFVNLIRECETRERGVLLDGFGLRYITRSSRYGQDAALMLDASVGELGDPFEPEDDDQGVVNLVTVKRKDGSSYTAEQVDGPKGTDTISITDADITVNASADTSLKNLAYWILGLGTVDEPYRYPTLIIDLTPSPTNVMVLDWRTTDIGDRIDVTNLDDVDDTVPDGTLSLALEGYTELLTPFRWTVTANCSPYQPWNVAKLGSTFRLEAAGMTLGADLDPGDTTISIATASGHHLFTTSGTYPDDFPLDLNVGGWKVHVTSNTDGTTPQVAVCDPAPNTSTIPAGTTVKLWRPAVLGL